VASPADIRPHLWEATAFLAPFRAGAGTKIKILEAMAAHVPIVATQTSMQGLPAVADTHYLVVEDTAAIPRAFARLISDPNLATALAANAAELVAAFDWTHVGDQIVHHIERGLLERG
jgi:glycosyltransferase involved in cell wall biosynthesis